MPEYASWLEGFVKRVLTDQETVSGMVLAIVRPDHAIEMEYWNCMMMDKLIVAGVIQQDAMLDTLAANADGEGDELWPTEKS